MAVKIKSLKKLVENNGIKILVHGPAGAGKTVLCCTTGEPTLLISAESGLLSVKDAPSYIKGAEIETLDDLEELYDFLVDDDAETFKWVALDSITEIAERVLHAEKSAAKDPRMAYGNLTDHMMDLLRRFRDLRGYNVIMSCKQQMVNDDGKSSYRPMMPGQQLPQQVPYIFDEIFALRVEQDEEGVEYRILQTDRDVRYEAKDRSGALDTFEEPNLKAIAEKISGVMKDLKKSEKHVDEDDEVQGKDEEPDVEMEDEQEEQEQEQEEQEEHNDGPVAEKKTYWYLDEGAGEIGITEKGERLPAEHERLTKAQYDKMLSEMHDNA